MPKKGQRSRSGNKASSSRDAVSNSSPGLLRKVSEKRKVHWRPMSETTVELLSQLVKGNALSVMENKSPSDVKAMEQHIEKLNKRMKQVLQETDAPANTVDYMTLDSEYSQHLQVLKDNNKTLKKLEKTISKQQELLEVKQREIEDLERLCDPGEIST